VDEGKVGVNRSVNGCARCGTDHETVWFFKFEQPIEATEEIVFTEWGECPITGDPILWRTIPIQLPG
jgi:hypothetical protein